MPRGASISVSQAIAAAGGTLHAFSPKEATLMRRQSDGGLIRAKLELDRIMQGEDPDVLLAAGDILIVPHTFETRLEEFLARAFVFRFGMDTTYNPWTYYYFKKDRESREDFGGTGGFFSTFGRQLTSELPALLEPVP
jgi:hypothetical protein